MMNLPRAVVLEGQSKAILMSAGGTNTQGVWSGYQFCNNNGGGSSCTTTPSVAATGALMYWTQPNVYVPTGTGAPGCNGSTACGTYVWAGLDSGVGGVYFLQTGSIGIIRDDLGIQVTNYYLFWEDYESTSSGATLCTGLLNQNLISPGDTIEPTVTLSSGTSYNLYTKDTTNGNSCTSNPNPYTFSHTPYFEDFIVERGIWNSVQVHLAKFDTTTIYGQVEWGTTWYPISRPNGDGWYYQSLMVNNGVTSACAGSWSSGTCSDSVSGGITAGTWGSFTETWVSSEYT
jgi:hypothetical protein